MSRSSGFVGPFHLSPSIKTVAPGGWIWKEMVPKRDSFVDGGGGVCCPPGGGGGRRLGAPRPTIGGRFAPGFGPGGGVVGCGIGSAGSPGSSFSRSPSTVVVLLGVRYNFS